MKQSSEKIKSLLTGNLLTSVTILTKQDFSSLRSCTKYFKFFLLLKNKIQLNKFEDLVGSIV